MNKRFKHFKGEERGVILAEYRRGASLGAIQGNRFWPKLLIYCSEVGVGTYHPSLRA